MNYQQEIVLDLTTKDSSVIQNNIQHGNLPLSHDKNLTTEVEKGWKLAQERVLLYLEALHVPPIRGLELALGALQRAAKDKAVQISSDHTISATMKALHELLNEADAVSNHEYHEGSSISLEIISGKSSAPKDNGNDKKLSGSDKKIWGSCIVNMPPINRNSMVPGEFDRKPWRRLLAKIFKPWKKPPSASYSR
jgi:hypothetical protein